MNGFYFSRFIFTIRGKTTLLLPAYKGSTLRGGFGHAFRRIVCVYRDRECKDCLLKEKCVYSWVFETPVPSGAEILRKYPAAPHPFVIEPPMDDQRAYRADDEMSFGLTLIGRAVDYLPYFIYAFEELGRIGIGKGKGNFQLVEVAEESPLHAEESPLHAGESPLHAEESPLHAEESPLPNEKPKEQVIYRSNEKPKQQVIYRGNDKMLAETGGPVKWQDIMEPLPPSELRLLFLSPTRIKYENSLTKELEFHIFFRNLLRRISLLSYFHCGQKLDDSGFKGLIEQAGNIKTVKRALHWEDWGRYSNRQETLMKMGGFMGEAIYEGDFSPFWPYIRLGEYVHVGKGSGFGLGRYEISN